MITNLHIDAPFRAGRIVSPGDHLRIRVWTDQPKATVKIRCFVRPPEPPAYQACNACGEFSVTSGDEHQFIVSPDTFADKRGFVNVEATDSTGHIVADTVQVEP